MGGRLLRPGGGAALAAPRGPRPVARSSPITAVPGLARACRLLDPTEVRLIGKILSMGERLRAAGRLPVRLRGSADPVLRVAEEAAAFYEQLARAVSGGEAPGILEPMLADHLRREAVKFVDELKRTRLR